MTAMTADRPARTTWIDTQPAHLIDAAIEMIQADDPDAWKLFDGDRSPRYALWAYLCLGHTDTLPFPAAMDLVAALRGSAGRRGYQSGMSPAEAALTLPGDTTPRHRTGSGRDPRSPAHPVRPVEVTR